MALKGTMLLNGADYAPFNLHGVGVLWRIPGRESIETMDYVALLKARDLFLRENTG